MSEFKFLASAKIYLLVAFLSIQGFCSPAFSQVDREPFAQRVADSLGFFVFYICEVKYGTISTQEALMKLHRALRNNDYSDVALLLERDNAIGYAEFLVSLVPSGCSSVPSITPVGLNLLKSLKKEDFEFLVDVQRRFLD